MGDPLHRRQAEGRAKLTEHVTDFLDLRFWPAFNLADSFIVVGVGILLLALISADHDPRRSRRVSDATARP